MRPLPGQNRKGDIPAGYRRLFAYGWSVSLAQSKGIFPGNLSSAGPAVLTLLPAGSRGGWQWKCRRQGDVPVRCGKAAPNGKPAHRYWYMPGNMQQKVPGRQEETCLLWLWAACPGGESWGRNLPDAKGKREERQIHRFPPHCRRCILWYPAFRPGSGR